MTAENKAIIDDLVAQLRRRDLDPAYANAPAVDPYARISRVYDGWDKTKVDDQTIDILRWMLATPVKLRLGTLLADNALSAWKPSGKRPGFLAGLDRMEAGQSQGLVAYNTDRITRQLIEADRLVKLGSARGIKIWSCTASELDLTTVDGQRRLYDQTAYAWYESARKSERLQSRFAHQRERRRYQERNQFGYPWDTHPDDSPQLAAERDAIAWGIGFMTDRGDGRPGDWGRVAAEFNRRGLRTRASLDRDGNVTRGGAPFNLGKVRNLLLNPRHAGFLTINVGEDGKPDPHGAKTIIGVADEKPIVDEDTWNRFQAVLAGRKGRRGSINPNHLLSDGLCRCSECGAALVGSTYATRYTDGEWRRAYRCSATTGCKSVGIDARVLERIVMEDTIAEWSRPGNAGRIARRDARLATVDERIGYWTQRQAELFDLWNATGAGGRRRMTNEQYESASDAAMAELDRLHTERASIVESDIGAVTVKARAEAEADWQRYDTEDRREMIRAVFPLGLTVKPPAFKRQRATVDNARQRISPIKSAAA